MLTPEEEAELARLRALAFGRGAVPLDGDAVDRLLALETLQAGGAPTTGTAPDEDAVAEHDDPVQDAAEPDPEDDPPAEPRPTPRGALIGTGLLVAGILIGLPLSLPGSGPAPEPTPTPAMSLMTRPDADDWDAGTIRYLGSYLSADLWLATRDEGETTCMLALDRFIEDQVPWSTCSDTTYFAENGLRYVNRGPMDGDPANDDVALGFSVAPIGGIPVLTIWQERGAPAG